MSETVTADCPREDAEGNECEGTVHVTLEFEPTDPSYGCDRDGNRGIYVAGFWCATAADVCTRGHTMTDGEKKDIQNVAENEVTVDAEDEYYGPDGPDDDY